MASGSFQGLLLTTVVATLLAASWPAGAAHTTTYVGPPLQPGDVAQSSVAQCTLGFAFKEGSKVYFAIAGHCVSLGSDVSSTDFSNFGTVVYKNTVIDVALIQVKNAFKPHVVGTVKGMTGVPTGYTLSSQTSLGDPIRTSGYGAGFGATQTTQEERSGMLMDDDAISLCATLPSWWGDSGAPVTHGTKALGLVLGNGLNCGAPVIGVTVEGILAWTDYHGYNLELILG